MGRMRPIGPLGWVVSWARAYVTETYGRASRVPIGPNSDFFAPDSRNHAGFRRHPVPPMSAHPPAPDEFAHPAREAGDHKLGRAWTTPPAGTPHPFLPPVPPNLLPTGRTPCAGPSNDNPAPEAPVRS